jgi:hypothetical protein
MQISVKRSGGYAGQTEQVAFVDTARLGNEAAQQIKQLLRESGFYGFTADESLGGIGADLFRFEITVRNGGKEHTIAFHDDGGPELSSLRHLIHTLTQMG